MSTSFTEVLHRILEPLYYKFMLVPRARRKQDLAIELIRKQGIAKIAFIVSSLPMWRFQPLYNCLNKDNSFQVSIVLYPFSSYDDNQKEESIRQLRLFFEDKRIPLLDLSKEPRPGEALRKAFDPDIVFFPQPYNHLFENDLDSNYFEDKLICYIPYAMLTSSEPWAYKNHLENIAWRLYFSSKERESEAKEVLFNGGKNIRIVGESMSDLFSEESTHSIWKEHPTRLKRVIWAPHFSINGNDFQHRASFIIFHQALLDIAHSYQGRIQFAFKPHPRLQTELYKHPEWGKTKTDEYFQRWATGENTQLVTGDYIDLFKDSDAMIHDCGSFSVEYHFTGNPVLFISENLNDVTNSLNDFGKEAILAHYQGSRKEDIIHFIDSVVLNGEDPMRSERERFRKKYLTPPSGQSVAYNIYRDLVSSLGFEK